MAFTTPCFVRVKDVEKRKEIANLIGKIGYKVLASDDQEYLVADPKGECMWMGLEGNALETFARDYHDCGEDTDLFLALAAMRDDTDDRQWFTDGVDWGIFHQANPEDKLDVDGISFPYLPRQGYNIDNFHKATAAEIVEHYKNKR